MAVYFKNNTSGEFFMDCLGFDFQAKSIENCWKTIDR